MNFNRILCPLDFSENNDKILKIAVKMASRDSAIILFHHSLLIAPDGGANVAVNFEIDQEVRESNLKQLQDEADRLKVLYPEMEFKTYHSYQHSLVDELNDVVNKESVDLIVMGTHGRTGLSRLFMGSVAEDIMRHTTCPVFLVKL